MILLAIFLNVFDFLNYLDYFIKVEQWNLTRIKFTFKMCFEYLLFI